MSSYTPDENERAVLNVLREHGRANPYLIREESGLRKEYVSQALNGLTKAGLVEKVTKGLYDHVPGNDEMCNHERNDIDLTGLRRALDDIEAAAERGDGTALQQSLKRARDAIND